MGILLVVGLIVLASRLGLTGFAQMGFVPPKNWLSTVLLGVVVGSAISLLSMIVIQPFIESITKQPHDLSIAADVQGSWKGLLTLLVLVWTFVAFGEEILFHGFMMSQLIKLLGTGPLALVVNVLLVNLIFGFAHAYQGRSAIWSTGIIGACLSVLYILSGFNLWLPIITHGAIDTLELILMRLGVDRRLRGLIWKRSFQPVA